MVGRGRHAVAAELATGTFYLLMIALGLAAGAIAAHLGLAQPSQLVAAAVVGGGATALWHWQRAGARRTRPPARQNRDVNLDIGERVHVAAWATTARRASATAARPGRARLQPGAPALPGEHVVVAVEGNWLVLAPAPSEH